MRARDQSAWLFGPLPDLFLGAGVLYLVMISALIVGGRGLLDPVPSSWFAYIVLIFSGSHYGATLLRVYEHEAERRVYRVFTVYGTILIGLALVSAVHSAIFGSLLITLYLTWSPWHYTGQNFGISMMFLRRRGVEVTPLARRLLYASFILSFASVFLNFHFAGGVSQSSDPLGYSSLASSGFHFISLGLPGSIRSLALPIVGLAYLATSLAAGALLLRSGSAKDVAPTALVMLTQAIWFSIPHLGFYFDVGAFIPAFDARGGENFRFYFLWTAVGHAIQYLWITTYYARSDRRWHGYGNYLSKTFILGNAVWAAPVLIFAPGLLGSPDYESGLAMCVAAAVNLHHFVLDGAIWKLRNPRIAAVLLRSQTLTDGEALATAPPRWHARVAWSLAALFCLAKIIPYVEIDRRLPIALGSRDYATAESILDRAAFYGRDTANLRAVLANGIVQTQNPAGSIRNYWRSLEYRPNPSGFAELGRLVGKLQGVEEGISTWEKGLEQFPDDADLNMLLGIGLMEAGRTREALPYLGHAIALRPNDERTRAALDTAAALDTPPD
jgi:tetratricopeptide (TPR) repeat protein